MPQDPGLQYLPAAIQAILQTNMLDRRFQDNIKSRNVYRQTAYRLPIPKRSGESIIYSRNGHITPVLDDIVPSTNTGLDNGLTGINGIGGTGDFSFEQWRIMMGTLPKFMDLNVVQEQEVIADLYKKNIDELSYNCALSMDLRVMRTAFRAYMSGRSSVLAATTSNTVARVSNLLGLDKAFATITVNGKVVPTGEPQPVSALTPLNVTITRVADGTKTSAQIVAATPDDTSGNPDDVLNTSNLGVLGRSGTIAFSAAQTLFVGDVVEAFDAPVQFRPNAKNSLVSLDATDTIGAQLVIDAVAELRANGVMSPLSDGTYPCYIDPIVMAQFFTDPQFQVMSQGQYKSDDFANATVSPIFGVTFVQTTNSPAIPFTNHASQSLVARHCLITGEKYVQESPFEGTEAALRGQRDGGVQDLRFIDDVVFATRAPLDRMGQIVSMGWYWIGGHVVPTDATITPDTVPSASVARYKRGAVIQVAAAR